MTKHRTYEKTHPWISFQVNLDHAGMGIWSLLGEAKAKCEHTANLPIKPSIANELAAIYLTKGVKGTTAIEGNTLTEEQVQERIAGTLKLPPSQEYLGQEVDNIVNAIKQIAKAIRGQHPPQLTIDLIKEFNRYVLDNLTLDDGVRPGEISPFNVGVFQYRGAPRDDCDYLLERLCNWLNSEYFSLPHEGRDTTIMSAILKAIIAHLYIAWIHPFGDGNGRTARLVEFFILSSSGVPDIAAHLLSNHYNLTRTEYYKELDHASQSGGETLSFIHYALQGFVDGLQEQLEMMRHHQVLISWQNFVHESFEDKTSKADKRRRDLVLALSLMQGPAPLKKIREASPKVAADYAKLHPRTLARDLNEVIKMDLVREPPEGYIARMDKILAFLPFQKMP